MGNLFYTHCGSLKEKEMIVAATVFSCFFMMWVLSKIGRGYNMELAAWEDENIRRNMHHYADVIRDDSMYWTREGGRRFAGGVTNILDKLNRRKESTTP